MKTFFISLMEHATDEINFEKKEMFPLTEKKQNKTKLQLHQDVTQCYICRKKNHAKTC